MSLLDILNQDLKIAMRSGDDVAKRTLRGVKAAITRAEKDRPDHLLTDDEIVAILRKQAKQRQDSIEAYARGGREDLVAAERAELSVIEKYLPRQMGEEEIRSIATTIMTEMGATGPRDMGKVMGKLMAQLKGKADGRLVNKIVRDMLKGA